MTFGEQIRVTVLGVPNGTGAGGGSDGNQPVGQHAPVPVQHADAPVDIAMAASVNADRNQAYASLLMQLATFSNQVKNSAIVQQLYLVSRVGGENQGRNA